MSARDAPYALKMVLRHAMNHAFCLNNDTAASNASEEDEIGCFS